MNTQSIEEELRQIESEIAVTEASLERLRLEKLGAQALMARMDKSRGTATLTGSGTRTAGGPAKSGTTPARLGNKDFIEQMLRDFPEGLHISDMQARALQAGRELNSEQVRSAVTYLKRKGKAETVTRGVWRLVGADAPTNAEATVSAVASDVPALTSERSSDDAKQASSSVQADDQHHSRMGATVGGDLT